MIHLGYDNVIDWVGRVVVMILGARQRPPSGGVDDFQTPRNLSHFHGWEGVAPADASHSVGGWGMETA